MKIAAGTGEAAVGELSGFELHLAGVEHADFHAANILVRLEPDGASRGLWLIDLHRVYFRSGLSDEQRFRNLAFLHQFFTGKSTKADRLRFHRCLSTGCWGQEVCRSARRRNYTAAPVPCAGIGTEIALIERSICRTAGTGITGWPTGRPRLAAAIRHVKKLDGSFPVAAAALPRLNRHLAQTTARRSVNGCFATTSSHWAQADWLSIALPRVRAGGRFGRSSRYGVLQIGGTALVCGETGWPDSVDSPVLARPGSLVTPCCVGKSTRRARFCASNSE